MMKVRRGDIRIGEPLPYSIYDQHGVLLLKEGYTINAQQQLDVLLRSGVYSFGRAGRAGRTPGAQQAQEEEQNVFKTMDQIKERLLRIFEQYRQGRSREEFLARIEDIAHTVQEACTQDSDSALANLLLDYVSSYAVVHHLLAALLCELIGRKLEENDDTRLTLVKAALTYDLSLQDIQDILDRQTTALTPEQQARILAHPADGIHLLQELGVTDDTWLDAVVHHHERLDGSGYPDKYCGDQIKVTTRILAVADIFSAMVRERPYRKAMISKDAMRNMMLEQGSKIDLRLIQMLIKELGVFPPGTIVKLSNGEIGVVKQRQGDRASPVVFSFVNRDGMPMQTPIRRDTTRADFSVQSIVPFSAHKTFISLIRGLWLNA